MACSYMVCVFFFKQKTAYEMRISDWSSDVCSSDLGCGQSHDWYVERFSSEVDAQVHRLPEHQQAYALQIAEEYGDYATPAERQATQDWNAENGICMHGIDRDCCPAGCGDLEY